MTDSIPDGRIALRIREAYEALGLGRSKFYADVLPSLKKIGEGRSTRIPVSELRRWVAEHAK